MSITAQCKPSVGKKGESPAWECTVYMHCIRVYRFNSILPWVNLSLNENYPKTLSGNLLTQNPPHPPRGGSIPTCPPIKSFEKIANPLKTSSKPDHRPGWTHFCLRRGGGLAIGIIHKNFENRPPIPGYQMAVRSIMASTLHTVSCPYPTPGPASTLVSMPVPASAAAPAFTEPVNACMVGYRHDVVCVSQSLY